MSSLEALFWDVDDFCVSLEAQWDKKLLSCGVIKRKLQKNLCLSKTIDYFSPQSLSKLQVLLSQPGQKVLAFNCLGARSLAS